jgi:transposase
MDHKQGTDRNQMFMFCLESTITNDAFVRVVDAFVDAIDLKSFGFSHVDCQGRPPYHPSVLLKLYLYGYRYGIIHRLRRFMSSSFVVGSDKQET